MDGVSDAVNYQLRHLLPVDDPGQRYYRFDVHLRDGLDDLDAAHRANIIALKLEATRILEDPLMRSRFEELCDKLVE